VLCCNLHIFPSAVSLHHTLHIFLATDRLHYTVRVHARECPRCPFYTVYWLQISIYTTMYVWQRPWPVSVTAIRWWKLSKLYWAARRKAGDTPLTGGVKKNYNVLVFQLQPAVQRTLVWFWLLSLYTLCSALENAFLFRHHKCRLHHTVQLLPSDCMHLWLSAVRLVCCGCIWLRLNQYDNLNWYLNISSIKLFGWSNREEWDGRGV